MKNKQQERRIMAKNLKRVQVAPEEEDEDIKDQLQVNV